MVSPLGSVPNGWRLIHLKDIVVKVGSGATPKGGQSAYLPCRKEHALIRSQNVFDRRFSEEGLAYISDEQAYELRNARVLGGDLLLNITGDGITFGRACLAPESILPACVNQHVSIVRPNPDVCCSAFLLSYLTHPIIKGYIESFNAGGSRRAITKGHIESFEIPLPPIDEQRRITGILNTLDDKIDLNRRMSETLEAIARAVFKSWFVDFDPVRAKTEGREPASMDAETAALFPGSFQDSILGPIPAGWAVRRLSEITTKIGSGATPAGGSKVYVHRGVSLIRSQNVHDYDFRWDGLARITDEAADELKGVTVQPGDVLINITGDSILRTCVVDPDVLPARVNHHVSIVRAVQGVPHNYIHLFLVRQQIKDYLLGFDSGGSRKAITKGHLESVPVLLPPPEHLTRFAAITNPMVARIIANRAENRILAALRDALLPKLLSGEIRV